MSRIAKAYIALIICSGAMVLLFAAGSWSSSGLRQFLTFLGLVVVSSTLKVRIPGIEGTMSPNFVFLVLATAFCSFSELVAISLVAALVQSLWTTKRPQLVQVAFSTAALVLSSSLAYQASYLLLGSSTVISPVAFVILAGSLYLPLNTALVSAVIGLVDGKSLPDVGSRCYQYVFPYFMGGIVFAGLVSGAFPRSTAWRGAIVLIPVILLGYLYSMSVSPAVATAPIQSAHTEDEESVEVGSGLPRSRY
jgi:hypothetical protein